MSGGSTSKWMERERATFGCASDGCVQAHWQLGKVQGADRPRAELLGKQLSRATAERDGDSLWHRGSAAQWEGSGIWGPTEGERGYGEWKTAWISNGADAVEPTCNALLARAFLTKTLVTASSLSIINDRRTLMLAFRLRIQLRRPIFRSRPHPCRTERVRSFFILRLEAYRREHATHTHTLTQLIDAAPTAQPRPNRMTPDTRDT